MIYDIAQQQPELDFMQTPVEPVSFDVLDWPYPALRLTVVGKPGTKNWRGHEHVVSFAPTVELGQLLTGIPGLASTTIYKVVTKPYMSDSRAGKITASDDSAYDDAALDDIQNTETYAYLVTLEDAERLLGRYGLTPDNAATLQHMVRTVLASQDEALYIRHPQQKQSDAWGATYGLDVITKAFGDYEYARIPPLELAWPDSDDPESTERYVDVRTLITMMAVYEHANQRGSKLPPLPNPKVSLMIDSDGLKGVLFDVGAPQVVALKAENADKVHADNIRKIERLRKQITDAMYGVDTSAPVTGSFDAGTASARDYYTLLMRMRSASGAMELAQRDIEDGTVKVKDVDTYLQPLKNDLTQAQQRVYTLERQIRTMQMAIITAYVAVVAALEKEREKVLFGYMLLPQRVQDVQVLENKLQEAKGHFTKMPSNMMDMYNLFSALPDTARISTEVDEVNQKVLIVRPGLKEPHTQLSLKYMGEDDDVDVVIREAKNLGVMGGYMAMAYRAVFALYQQKGGLSETAPKMVTITMNELFAEMYGVDSFPKGISKMVRGQSTPHQIFWGLMHLLQRINFEVPGQGNRAGKKDWITGIFPMQKRSAAHETDSRKIYVDLMLNAHLFEDMTGVNGHSVSFKLSKNKPMREYHHSRRDRSCAMQFVIESQHRMNLKNTPKDATIITYDTMTLGMLAHKMGVVPSQTTRGSRLVEQLCSSLDELKEHDVVSKWRLSSGTGKGVGGDPLTQRVYIESGKGYVLQREITQAREELQKVKDTIENPLRRHKVEAVEAEPTKPANKPTRNKRTKTKT